MYTYTETEEPKAVETASLTKPLNSLIKPFNGLARYPASASPDKATPDRSDETEAHVEASSGMIEGRI